MGPDYALIVFELSHTYIFHLCCFTEGGKCPEDSSQRERSISRVWKNQNVIHCNPQTYGQHFGHRDGRIIWVSSYVERFAL